MYKLFFLLLLSVISFLSCSRSVSSELETTTNTYNPTLAASVGADDYGMRMYVMAFLKRGPNRDQPKEEADALQAAHMENIGKLAESGKLSLAGPFMHSGDLRGIYVFNVETVEEAERLTNTDPAIKAGSLVMDLVPWYGSAALMKVNDIHNQIAKINM